MQERNVAVEEVVHTRGSCRDHILGDLNTAVVSPHTFSVFCSGHCSSVTITAEQFEDRNRVIWMKTAPACGSVRKRGKKERELSDYFQHPAEGEKSIGEDLPFAFTFSFFAFGYSVFLLSSFPFSSLVS